MVDRGSARPLEPDLPPEGEEAISLMMRVSADGATSRDHEDLANWLAVSPANRAMWQRLERSVDPLGVAGRHQGGVGAFAERAGRRTIDRRQLVRAALGVCGAGGLAAAVNRVVPLRDLTADHLTLTGQQKTIGLPNGSRLVLAPRTAVNTDFIAPRRDVELIDGQLLMRGPADVLPLTLRVGSMTLRKAEGTFVARRRAGAAELVAIDMPGTVDCGTLGEARIEKGQCLQIADGTLLRRKAKLLTETAWVDGSLVVDNEALKFVIDRMEPYYTGLITIDPDAREKLVTGAFPLGEIDTAIETIGAALDLPVTRRPFWISIGAPTSTTRT